MKNGPNSERFSRHLSLPEVGEEGQALLSKSSVLIIGAGGLGSPAALYLAAAGVGRIGIVDADLVELSNLQRQILHSTSDIGMPKVASAEKRLNALNPECQVETYEMRLDPSNARELISKYDLVIDGSDNFATRYVVSDACVLAGKPDVYGAVFRFDAQVSVFGNHGPCYRCLYPESPETSLNCSEVGVLGVLPGIVGTLQATEALKIILKIGTPLRGRVLIIDALDMEFRTLQLKPRESCLACSGTLVWPEIQKSFLLDLKLSDFDPSMAPQILDVRSEEEFSQGQVLAGALNIPLSELSKRLGELDATRETIVYCKSGIRSRGAGEYLLGAGFKNVRRLLWL